LAAKFNGNMNAENETRPLFKSNRLGCKKGPSNYNRWMQLLIVILNYNGFSFTADCLESLEPELKSLPDVHVGLCDNGSDPAEADRLGELIAERGWSNWITYTRLSPNLGFTGGNNAVIRPALASQNPPRYVLLLNNDTIVRPGAIKALIDFMNSRPDVGIAGSRLENPDGSPQVSAFRFLNAFNELDRGLRVGFVTRLLNRYVMWLPIPDEPTAVDWLAGASMLIRREVFDAIGLLDEGYFTYFDDIDYCFVARKHNWPTWYVPQSRILHLCGKTTGITDRSVGYPRTPEYYYAARRRFLTKNLRPFHAAACDLAFAIGYSLHRLKCLVARRHPEFASHKLRDHIRHSVFIKGFKPPIVANPALNEGKWNLPV
jgi:N-acetylglucosaminyl-diphospho-decaprenol L-rhamnosyltransferase